MKVYKVQRLGRLMVVKTRIKGQEASAYPKLLIDTGSTYTIVAHEILESIGCGSVFYKERR